METLAFTATAEKGEVSALYLAPDNPRAIFVLAHGAGADMHHTHMQSLAQTLLEQEIASLRFNFPYMEQGGKRTDSQAICVETITNALALTQEKSPELPCFLAGHSFGGRMSSHLAANLVVNEAYKIQGLVYFSFPLHSSKKPEVKRADHLPLIERPQLFISGSRDNLASMELLAPIVKQLNNGHLHIIETADHGFKILKRTRQSSEPVYNEVGRVITNG